MKTYISILRGINVSGQKKILMVDLKKLFESLGFENVVTYIQSGNVIFKASETLTENEIITKIDSSILNKYNFQVPIIILNKSELKKTISNNPFIKEDYLEKIHVTFLAELPTESALGSIKKIDYSPDKFEIIGKSVYIFCPNGYGSTKLSNSFFESKLKVKATTRNWKTTNKLLEIYNEFF